MIGEMGEVNLDEFFCPNEACPDYGKRGRGNIVLKERYGKQNTALLRCKACNKTFSENRGTPFFGLHTPKETVLRALAMLVEKGSIRERHREGNGRRQRHRSKLAQKSWGTL